MARVETAVIDTIAPRRAGYGTVAAGLGIILGTGIVSLVPILFILLGSFDSSQPGEEWKFGLKGWEEALSSPRTLSAILYSFFLNIRHLIAIASAFVISWLLIRVRIPLRGFIEFSLWIAYFLPALPLALSWILLLDPHYGMLNSFFQHLGFKLNIYSWYGIIWVHLTATTIPIMTILLAPALRQMDASLEEAARVCGANTWQTFKRVLIPVLIPALLTVFLAGFIRGLEAFEIELLLGRPVGIDVYATRIYNLIQWDPPLFPQAMALSTLFLGILFILAMIYQRYTSQRSFATISGRGVSFRPMDIGKTRYWISGCLLSFIAFAVYLPVAVLIMGSFMRIFGYFAMAQPFTTSHWELVLTDPVFWTSMRNSFVVGLGAAGVGVLVYSLIGYALVRTSFWGKSTVSLLVWLPWAVPGILLGLAYLWLYLSVPVLAPIYGTFTGIILVLAVKEMPIGVHMIKTGFSQISQELEQAGRVCGAGWTTVYRRISLPLISPLLVSIFSIAFMVAIRDISTIVLVSSPSTKPLSLLMMEYSMDGRMEPAAIIGVFLSLFAVGVALLSRKLGLRSIN